MFVRSSLSVLSFFAHAVAAMVVLAAYHWLGTPVESTPFSVMSFESLMVAIAGSIGAVHGYLYPAFGRSALKNSMVRSATAELAVCLWCSVAIGGMVLGYRSGLPEAVGAAALCLVAASVWFALARKDNRTFERLRAQRGAVLFSLAV
jgi:hypothetical protein